MRIFFFECPSGSTEIFPCILRITALPLLIAKATDDIQVEASTKRGIDRLHSPESLCATQAHIIMVRELRILNDPEARIQMMNEFGGKSARTTRPELDVLIVPEG